MVFARGVAGGIADVTAYVTDGEVARVGERVNANAYADESVVETARGLVCLAAHEIVDGTARDIGGELALDCVCAVERKSRASRARQRAKYLALARSRACLVLIIGWRVSMRWRAG